MADELARVAFEASLRRLEKQEESLTEIRSRTGLLLAASSLSASFLGRPALDADPVVLVFLALAAFAASVGASLYVLLPKKQFFFSRAFRLAIGGLAVEIVLLLATASGTLG